MKPLILWEKEDIASQKLINDLKKKNHQQL